jgi:ATP-binding cassette subfamily B protein
VNRFRPYLQRHLWQWALSALCTLGAVACNVYIPRLLGWAIDDLRGPSPVAALPRYAGLMVGAAFISSTLYIVMRRLQGGASREVAYEIRRDLFHRLTLLEPAYFHGIRTGDLMNRFTGDLSAVQEMLGFGAVQAVNTLFVLGFTLTMMVRISPKLGVWVLCVFPLVMGLLAVLLRVVARRYAKVQEQLSRISARAQESFSGIRVVKGYAMEDREVRDYRALNVDYQKSVLRLARAEAPLWATVGLLMNGVFVVVLLVGGRLLLTGGQSGVLGGLTLGSFVTFVTYLFQLNWPMLSVGVVSNVFQRGVVSWRRLVEVLEREPGIADGTATDFSIQSLEGELRFEDVSLTLGGRTLLSHVNLHVPKGRTLGLTGKTGAGKTLLTLLLARQLEPTSGRILVDGHDVKVIPIAVLRRHLGYVPQEPFLFSDTLAENVSFGIQSRVDAERDLVPEPELVEWAGEISGLDPDVQRFPEKYQTILGERGVTLSGGQRQRTALARAVAKHPRILVLDDALSAVDTETESKILSHLKGVLAERTVLLIGHRVSTLRHANEIVVLENGQVVEQGTHEALLRQGGRYAALEKRQRLASALEAAS